MPKPHSARGMNYYNDNDPRCAAWLRELIKDGLIPPGDVDERSIADVTADDVQGYLQCHFFAGIGGWPLALQLAGWEGPVWTGSCPCQPFSCAGARKGTADKRHLWPEFYRLIREYKPDVLFGEQVGGTLGEVWLAGVYADLEAAGYRIPKNANGDPEAYSIPACSVGAPHIRQRLYWVADSNSQRFWEQRFEFRQKDGRQIDDLLPESRKSSADGRLADAECMQREQHEGNRPRSSKTDGARASSQLARCGEAGRLANPPSGGLGTDGGAQREAGYAEFVLEDGGMGDAAPIRRQSNEANRGEYDSGDQPPWSGIELGDRCLYGFWSNSIWLPCADGKARRCPESVLFGMDDGLPSDLDLGGAESAFPLCEKIPGRVMLLRGYGNAINPYLAAEFVMSYLEARHA